jgi:hypothetical protein
MTKTPKSGQNNISTIKISSPRKEVKSPLRHELISKSVNSQKPKANM